ncbi:MAG TPA: PEP-CTERM sorting domain-containing protein [Verrucomicrobiales bacterium]|nr:PEP-CTERM sorting domain-containing protein [Verrucomicrobiales bacterium]
MKIAATLAALVALTGVSFGASITVTNFRSANTNLVADSSNTLIPNNSGYVAIGVFGADDAQLRTWASSLQGAEIANAFVQFSNNVSVGFNNFGGIYQTVISGAISAGDSFAGQNVYTVIGNSSSLAGSSELLVFKHNHVFMADPSPTANTVLMLDAEAGEAIIGISGENTASLGPVIDQPTFQTVTVIPEPSSILLLLSGAGAFLLRRKRK